MSKSIVEITQQTAQQLLITESSQRPVVVDFWADWCVPCKALLPILEKLANDYGGAFLLAKVNAELLADITSQFGVRSLPTIIILKDGQPVDACQGLQSEVFIREMLNKHLSESRDNVC